MFWPEPISFAAMLRSYNPTILTMAVSLITVIISFPSAGITFLIACGATIFRKIVHLDNPKANPASVCPASTDCMPLRITSAVYAAEMLYKSDQGQQKKQYVIDLLAKQGYILDPDKVEDTMQAQIEAMVKELKIEQAQVK